MDRAERFNKAFNLFILAGMTIVTVLVTVFKLRETGDMPTMSEAAPLLIAAAGSLAGVLSTVCSANGRILTFLFGLIDVTVYGVMCLTGAKYGNAALHLLYFLPMQLIGFMQWRRRGASEGARVRPRRLDGRGRLLSVALFVLGVTAAGFLLSALDRTESDGTLRLLVWTDAFSMMCNILGQFLMTTAYAEQWFFWIGVNVSSVLMWVLTLRQTPDSSYALIYVVKYAFYLLNSFNGLRIWLSMSRQERG